MTGIAVVLVDKLGRRILLVASDVLMSISILGLGANFYLDENKGCDVVTNTTSTTTYRSTPSTSDQLQVPSPTFVFGLNASDSGLNNMSYNHRGKYVQMLNHNMSHHIFPLTLQIVILMEQ